MTGMLAWAASSDDDLVRSGPGDDRIHEPLEVAGHVADALAGTQDRVVGQVDGVAAELGHARHRT